MAKILILDIETSPSIAYVWSAWKANIGINQIKENGYLMSYSAKWLGKKKVEYKENRHGNDRILVKNLVRLLDEADIVVAHNAKRFDIPTILGRAVIHGIAPPSPYKVVDTLITAKRDFRFFRNNLEYIAQVLGCAPKMKHNKFPGFELWLQCLKQNDEAWEEMKTYNIQDVITLEEVYLKMRPFMRNHPNVGVFNEEDQHVCPNCGGKHLHKRGTYRTNVSVFQRFRCVDCGAWSRGRTNILDKKKRKELLANAL